MNTQRMRVGIWLLVFALAGCGIAGQRPPDSLTIGALLPLTGSLASYGESSRAALEEAVATINAAGDRASGDYDFWAVCRVGNTLAWGKAAVSTNGEAKRVTGCDQQPR